jgi:hypothetical protein
MGGETLAALPVGTRKLSRRLLFDARQAGDPNQKSPSSKIQTQKFHALHTNFIPLETRDGTRDISSTQSADPENIMKTIKLSDRSPSLSPLSPLAMVSAK